MAAKELIAWLATATDHAQLRAGFMESARELVEATAWGLDWLDSHQQVVASEWQGLPDTFCDRYRQIGLAGDPVSQAMVQHHIPVHTQSWLSRPAWHQSPLYQQVFRPYNLDHGLVAPLVGKGQVIGGVYFLRRKGTPAFTDSDLLHVSAVCHHLSVRLATFQLMTSAAAAQGLTARELDIAERVARGYTNRDIAEQLHISQDAVKQSLKRIFRKLGVSARAAMVARLKA